MNLIQVEDECNEKRREVERALREECRKEVDHVIKAYEFVHSEFLHPEVSEE